MAHSDERRRLPRRRTRLSAAAVCGEGEIVLCTIRDKSEHGARLLTGPGTALPDGFALVELSTGMAHSASVVWRDAAFLGVTLQNTRLLSPTAGLQDRRLLEVRARLTAKPSGRSSP